MEDIKDIEKKEEVEAAKEVMKVEEVKVTEVKKDEKVIEAKNMISGRYYKTAQKPSYVGYIYCETCTKDLDGGDIIKVENLITENMLDLRPFYKVIEMDADECKAAAKECRKALGFCYNRSQMGRGPGEAGSEDNTEKERKAKVAKEPKVKKEKGPTKQGIILECFHKGTMTREQIVAEVKKTFPDDTDKNIFLQVGCKFALVKKLGYKLEGDKGGVIKISK